MEHKVRRESQSLMEKVFNRFARRGSVKCHQIQTMMREMHPDFATLDQDEMNNMIGNVNREGTGAIDMEGFNKIAMHFLLKQQRHDHDAFIHKHEVTAADFPDAAPIF